MKAFSLYKIVAEKKILYNIEKVAQNNLGSFYNKIRNRIGIIKHVNKLVQNNFS